MATNLVSFPTALFTVNTSGTLTTIALKSQLSGYFLAGNGTANALTFRGILSSDLAASPVVGKVPITSDTNGGMTWATPFATTDTAEQDLGALTWTGVTSPSGTITKKYRWSRQGKMVTIAFKITASVAGLLNTAVSFPLPTDMPNPATFASQPNSTHITIGPGLLGATANSIAALGATMLTVDGSGNFLIQVTGTGVAGADVWGTVTYFVG